MQNLDLDKVSAALDILRLAYRDITVMQAIWFVSIGASPGIAMLELQRRLGITKSVASRAVAVLSDGDARSRGLGLVVATEHPKDQRQRLLKLSPAGKKLMEKFEKRLANSD